MPFFLALYHSNLVYDFNVSVERKFRFIASALLIEILNASYPNPCCREPFFVPQIDFEQSYKATIIYYYEFIWKSCLPSKKRLPAWSLRILKVFLTVPSGIRISWQNLSATTSMLIAQKQPLFGEKRTEGPFSFSFHGWKDQILSFSVFCRRN